MQTLSWLPNPDSAVALEKRHFKRMKNWVTNTLKATYINPIIRLAAISEWEAVSVHSHPFLYEFAFSFSTSNPGCAALQDSLMNYCLARELNKSRKRAALMKVSNGMPIDIASLSTLRWSTAALRAEKMLLSLDRDSGIFAASLPEFCSARQKLISALTILRDIWPEMSEEISHHIKQVVLFKSDSAIGFADFYAHGSIYLKIGNEASVLQVLEDFVHESSHVCLNSKLTFHKIYSNEEDELYETPLRKDRRPMFGLIHQAFVLKRLIELFERINKNEVASCGEKLERMTCAMRSAIRTIDQYAVLTADGRCLRGSFETAG